MPFTIATTSVTGSPVHGTLTENVKDTPRLEGWEAFNNFFMKSLDHHQPWMSLEDKEKSLHEIFEFIWDSNTAAVPDKEHSIDTLWPVIQRLYFLTGGEVARTLEFRVIPSPDASVTHKLCHQRYGSYATRYSIIEYT